MTNANRSRISILCLAGGVVAALCVRADAAPPVDPFYSSLLHEGSRAFEEGEAAAAARDLRIACFGLLEDPPLLTSCLVRLGLAQAETEDKEGFFETFRRLAVVEQRFQTYAAADLPAPVRAQFEDWLVRLVPEAQLASVAQFADLAAERTAIRVRRLAPGPRRKEIEAHLVKHPQDLRWKLLLAELEIEERKPAAGLAIADAVLAAQPGEAEASCVRGWALSASGTCAAALEALAGCRRLADDVFLAEALLRCRVTLGQWSEARAFLKTLPDDMLADKQLAKLAKEVERGEAKASRAEANPKPAATAKSETPPAAPSSEPSSTTVKPAPDSAAAVRAPGPAPTHSEPAHSDSAQSEPAQSEPAQSEPAQSKPALSESDRERLEQARAKMNRSVTYSELLEPLLVAKTVADANPRVPEAQFLAAEIAYRASRFTEAVELFRRGGDPGDDRPLLVFYQAVALFESGNREAAATAMRRCLPKLERTPFVESYRARILGSENPPN